MNALAAAVIAAIVDIAKAALKRWGPSFIAWLAGLKAGREKAARETAAAKEKERSAQDARDAAFERDRLDDAYDERVRRAVEDAAADAADDRGR